MASGAQEPTEGRDDDQTVVASSFDLRPVREAGHALLASVVRGDDMGMAIGVINVLFAWHRAHDGEDLPADERGVYTGVIAKALGIRQWSAQRHHLTDVLLL